ncbi:hypothetical protein HHI36_015626, partial [Cryptolaemus montrouzieri]
AFTKYKKKGRLDDKLKYLEFKNSLSKLIATAKSCYMNEEMQSATGDSKKIWTKLKQWGVKCDTKNDLPKHLSDPDIINQAFVSRQGTDIAINEETTKLYGNIFNPDASFFFINTAN